MLSGTDFPEYSVLIDSCNDSVLSGNVNNSILTTHGGNGEGMRVVYSTANHQELYDYTIKAFNTAWKYRFPTFVLGDGYQAKMREPLTIYSPEELRRCWKIKRKSKY
ncbi:MAG: 2-oxoglutarate ferredoxin oxidoreductase subunit alpha [Pelotomaculum sp. PtaB.Bin104]|nr:MAG: 2-oxoglutarate ferredoxin oxidoreductase subunit alpha [Pelotomaculum sp. PtaB.Bin104]